MAHFRHAAIALALFAGTSAAIAQTTVITREPVETQTVVTTRPPTLVLTPQQRQTVYRDIVRERVAPVPGTVTYSVGTRVPSNVRLYTVPDAVAVDVAGDEAVPVHDGQWTRRAGGPGDERSCCRAVRLANALVV